MSGTESRPEYMSLPKMKFKLSLREFQNDQDLKTSFLDIIQRNCMAEYYENACKQFFWDIDENLLQEMSRKNAEAWNEMESRDVEEDVKGNWREKLEFACRIGDFNRATEIATTVLENDTNSSSIKAEAAFGLFRVSYLNTDFLGMGKIIQKITDLIEGACNTGSDWCCRNKLKVYESVYCLAGRNFGRAADLLFDSIPTFESHELLTFRELVEYTILASMISLPRSELDKRFNRNGLLQQTLLTESPEYRNYFYALYECRYAEFFECLAWIEREMKMDPILHSHYRYYVREMRLRGYSQLLQAYRTLSLNRMAMEFGVTEEYIEQEVARFIANGRLHCKIDKVSGAIVTVSATGCDTGRAPTATCDRGLVYQSTIKRGDALLNRLKKLGRVMDF